MAVTDCYEVGPRSGPGNVALSRGLLRWSAGDPRRFLAALTTGDVPGLLEVLAPDVLVVGDGGGLAPTVPKPVRGAAKLAPVMARFAEVAPGALAFIVDLNGGIAVRIDPGGENDTAVSFVIEDGRITQLHGIRNPHKLQRLRQVAELRR